MRSREETRHLENALKGDRRLRPEDGSVCVRVKCKVGGERDIVEEGDYQWPGTVPQETLWLSGYMSTRYHGMCLAAFMEAGRIYSKRGILY